MGAECNFRTTCCHNQVTSKPGMMLDHLCFMIFVVKCSEVKDAIKKSSQLTPSPHRLRVPRQSRVS